MSARRELFLAMDGNRRFSTRRKLLDAYRDEVLREVAEMLRTPPLCNKPEWPSYFADLIDPDKEDQ